MLYNRTTINATLLLERSFLICSSHDTLLLQYRYNARANPTPISTFSVKILSETALAPLYHASYILVGLRAFDSAGTPSSTPQPIQYVVNVQGAMMA